MSLPVIFYKKILHMYFCKNMPQRKHMSLLSVTKRKTVRNSQKEAKCVVTKPLKYE